MPKPNKKRPISTDERITKKTRLSIELRKSSEKQVESPRKRAFPLWSQKLTNVQKTDDDFILGMANNLEKACEVIECHSRSLMCDYIKSRPNHGEGGKKKNVESGILWQSEQIQYDRIPFSVSAYYHFKCSYSYSVKHKSKAKSCLVKDSDDQNSEDDASPDMDEVKPGKQTCCPAKVTMKEIIKYPDYRIDLDASKVQKKAKLKKLRDDLQSGVDIKTTSKFIVTLPLQHVHNHEFSGKSRNINRRVKKQIRQFVTGGIKSPKKVKDKLTSFVKEEFKGICPPTKEDTAYYPSLKNIESYINTCSKNQDNGDVKAIVEAKEEGKEDTVFCEPSTLEEAVKIFCSDDLSDEFDTTDSCDVEGGGSICEKIRQKLEHIKRVTYSSTDEAMLINVYNTLVILSDQYLPKNETSSVISIVPNGHIPEMCVADIPEGTFAEGAFNGPTASVSFDNEGASRPELLMSSLPPNDAEGFQSESVQPVICSSSEDQIALLRQQILLDHDPT